MTVIPHSHSVIRNRFSIAGTAGHVDHGKTSLVKALTGIDTDKLKEEKARGITIELGFAHLEFHDGLRLGIVDVPGHERFVRTMAAGAAGIDLVILVIAADEGVMPQTREHLQICSLLGVKRGLVVLTKRDLVNDEWLDYVTEELREFLKGSFLEGAPVIPFSSRSGEGITVLREHLGNLTRQLPQREQDGPLRLPMDRIFTVPGFGPVVTGTVWSGGIRVGDPVELLPSGRIARVRGLQIHGRQEEKGNAGQRVAVNLQGIDHQEIQQGDTLVSPSSFRVTLTVDIRLELLPTARDLKHRSTVRLHSGTTESLAQVILIGRNSLPPGESAPAQLRLQTPLLLLPGDPFIIRVPTPAATIGGGIVLDPAPPRRRRRSEEALELLTAMDGDNLDIKILLLVRGNRLSGMSAAEIRWRCGCDSSTLENSLARHFSQGTLVQALKEPCILLSCEAFTSLEDVLMTELTSFMTENTLRDGMGKEELKGRLPKRSDHRFFPAILTSLTKNGRVFVQHELVKPASATGHRDSESDASCDAVASYLHQGGTEPPTVKELSERLKTPEKLLREQLATLTRKGQAIRIANDLYYAPEPLGKLRDQLCLFLRERGEITPADFRTMTGLSRKFMIPLLEYFDSLKLTIRIGDLRKLRRQ